MPQRVDAVDRFERAFEIVRIDHRLVARYAEGIEQRVEIMLGLELRTFIGPDAMGEKCERSFGDDLRVELFQRAGSGVARIGKCRQSRFIALGIHRRKGLVGHENFAPDFEQRRDGCCGGLC